MKDNQFFDELKTSLGQAINYVEGTPSKARTKTVAIKELAFFCTRHQKLASADEFNPKIICCSDRGLCQNYRIVGTWHQSTEWCHTATVRNIK